MTPDEARDLLDGATPGPWEVDESDHHVWAIGPIDGSANGAELCCQITDACLAAHAPDMAAMIAGMHEEWGVYYRRSYENAGSTEWGWVTREDAERSIRLMSSAYVCRIVRRYVTTPEEIT